MKKLMNEPGAFVDEMLEGLLLAHPDQLKSVGGTNRALVRADAPVAGKVGIVTGGGSGHLPVFLGYVGRGLASGVAIGNVFSSPSVDQIAAATRGVHSGKGVLYLYGNYSGDVLNFDSAAEEVEPDGIRVETVLVADDVASAPPERSANRRGVAGLFYVYKIAGAKAEAGGTLEEVKDAALKAAANCRTMGVGLTPSVLPTVGKPTFSLADDEMEIGIGIHGEPGIRRGKLLSADEITTDIVERLVADFGLRAGDQVSVLVNGLGATPLEELYIVYRKVNEILSSLQVEIDRRYIGEFATSLEMAGCSITLLKLDDELKSLLDAPASSPFFLQI
jgi:phosphoenolpyruvate---glycerone phosphotransferase subunit DhaK